jgi:NTE family protein
MTDKLALVLGGGGSRGLAHLGVLEVLHQHDVTIDFIVGTSMGAIVGVAYALGYSPKQITHYMTETQGSNVFNTNVFSARGRQRNLEQQLTQQMDNKTFADLDIPAVVMAVDVMEGKEIMLDDGPLIPAILASCAVPAVFPPVELNGKQLADGGVIDSLATHVPALYGYQKMIAVDVYPPLEYDDPWIDPISAIMGIQLPFNPFANLDWARIPSMMSSTWRASRIMTWYLHQQRLELAPPDILLRPNVGHYGSLDFTDVEGPLAAGRLEALRHLDKIKSL